MNHGEQYTMENSTSMQGIGFARFAIYPPDNSENMLYIGAALPASIILFGRARESSRRWNGPQTVTRHDDIRKDDETTKI